MFLVDHEIKTLAKYDNLIEPFVADLVQPVGQPSYGLSACGYDVRLAPEWLVSKNTDAVLDTRLKDKSSFYERINSTSLVIPAKTFVLARTLEYVKLPKDVMATLFCKSSLARCGLALPPTVIEPGWEGNIVVEIFNQANHPVKLYASDGVGQLLFTRLAKVPDKPYDTSRKYQGQTGIQLAI